MIPLTPANIDWSDPAAPLANEFGDFYFSKKDGIAETDYVFVQHNQLPERFISHQRNHFCVAETGFGTGLNLMVLWQHFREFRQLHPGSSCRQLHFVSFEKHPLTDTDLARAHKQWPEYAEFSTQIRANYPMAINGCHRMVLDDGAVIVDLWFGDLLEQLPRLSAGDAGVVDAWFLDGFTPSKNPQMWQPHLYQQMVRLSRADATVATFTAASAVRKGLIEAGFAMQKDKGFRGKREMIFGHLQQSKQLSQSVQTGAVPKRVAVIGAGIAGASCALALTRRGIEVDLYCSDSAPAAGASGNRQGALYPLLNVANDAMAQFYQMGYLFARNNLNTLAPNHPIAHQWCGVLQFGPNAKVSERLEAIAKLALPKELVHEVSEQQANHIADITINRTGLFFPYGGWLSPQQLTAATINEAASSGKLTQHYQHRLSSLTGSPSGWRLNFAHGVSTNGVSANDVSAHADAVIIAAGHLSNRFAQTEALPLNPVRGQIAYPQQQQTTSKLKAVLCADGYLVPAMDQRLTCGASFGRGDEGSDYRQTDEPEIAQRMDNSFGHTPWRDQLQQDGQGRAAVRAAVRDHLPLVGPILDWDKIRADVEAKQEIDLNQPPRQSGLYALTGLGSRGLCSGPLCAELLASQICGESQPLPQQIIDLLAPGRFWLRKLKKGQPLPE